MKRSVILLTVFLIPMLPAVASTFVCSSLFTIYLNFTFLKTTKQERTITHIYTRFKHYLPFGTFSFSSSKVHHQQPQIGWLFAGLFAFDFFNNSLDIACPQGSRKPLLLDLFHHYI